jgi:hypothetical protein
MVAPMTWTQAKQKSRFRGLLWALAFTLLGLCMVAGGVYGLIDTYTDGDDDEPSASIKRTVVPPPEIDLDAIGATDDCGELDPRLAGRSELLLEPVKGSGSGTVDLRCGGATYFFGIDITGADNPEDYVFADVFLYTDSKVYEKLGTVFYRDTDVSGVVGVPPGTDLEDYDSVVIVPRAITDNSGKPRPIAFRADF